MGVGRRIHRNFGKLAISALAIVATLAVALVVASTSGSEDEISPQTAEREQPAPAGPTYSDVACEDELAAAARERWSDGDRGGFGSDEAAVLELASGELAGEASKRWPQAFAGAWGEQPRGDRLFVAFTEGAKEKLAELVETENHPCPQLLEAVHFDYSIDDLRKLQREMQADREAARQEDGTINFANVPGRHHATDIDESRNAVLAFVEEETEDAAAELRERYGEHVILVEQAMLRPLDNRTENVP